MKKTALVLSGGGSRGAYEIGVWKALRELDIRLDIITGTSVGSINGAMIAQGDLELTEKLWKQLETEMVFDIDDAGSENKDQSRYEIAGIPAAEALAYAKEIVLGGGAGSSGLRKLLNEYIDENAVRSSGADYGLVATSYPDFRGSYLFLEDIPVGQLADYIMASASCFPAVQKCIIGDRKYIDGGYRDNMPVEMAMQKGASSIIAVDLQAAGTIRKDTLENAREVCDEFHLIRSLHDLGNFLVFDQKNTSRIMKLGYLDTMKEFDRLDGIKYTFRKGVFTEHQLEGADAAACILKLDPCTAYRHDDLNSALNAKLTAMVLPGENTDLMELIESIKKDPTQIRVRPQLLLYITESLQKDGACSIFLQPAVFRLLEDEIQAANYLINEGLAPFSHETYPS